MEETLDYPGESSTEYLWGCKLTGESPTVKWSFEDEDGDEDYLDHTLFLRVATLGKDATPDELNIVQVKTKDESGKDLEIPIVALIAGKQHMATIDLTINKVNPVVFSLVTGSGPVHLAAQHVIEIPGNDFGHDTETELDETAEDEELEVSKKRKSHSPKGARSKRGKLDSDENGDHDEEMEEDEEEDVEEEEEEDEDEEDEEEEDESDEESEDEKPKGKKGAKAKAKTKTNGAAAAKKPAKKVAGKKSETPKQKKGKKAKSK